MTRVREEVNEVPVVALDSLAQPETSSDPRNYLIIGTDSASRLDDESFETEGRGQLGTLADVIMILRVIPDEEKAYLLSIPRDTYLETAPNGTNQRINAAISGPNGPNDLIDTIRDQMGIEIHNYLEIDFRGFKDIVEILDGIPIYFETPVRDSNTGLSIGVPEDGEEVVPPGCVVLDPTQALAYARARHLRWMDEDGDWHSDGTGDFGRIQRQQDFLKVAAQRAIDRGMRDLTFGTANDLLNTAEDSILLDSTLSVDELLDVLDHFRSFDPERLETHTLPATPLIGENGANYLEPNWEVAEPILQLFRGDAGMSGADELLPSEVDVTVLNGSDIRGHAGEIQSALEAVGFRAPQPPSDGELVTQTTITYAPGAHDRAVLVARYLDPVPVLIEDPSLEVAHVVVTTGPELSGVLDSPVALDELPASVTEEPATTSTTSTSTSTTTTSTTEAGEDPDDAETEGESGDAGSDEGAEESTTTTIVPEGFVPTRITGTCR